MGANQKVIVNDLLEVFSIGLVAGICVSAIPFIVGLAVNLPFDIMRKG